MGTVHRALDPVLDREVAIKTISTGLDVEPEIKERFYREAKACARLQHPSIITVFDLGEIDNTAFIVMELLLGSDLRRVILDGTPIPLRVKLDNMANVCDALSHAHCRGIIHRDIKPSNLFLTKHQEMKVLDFGIARLPSSQLTVARPIMGTVNYLPPEMLQGKPADARSDLFSAAIVFFEFLTFRHPFQAPDILRRIADGAPDPINEANPELPADLERIFKRALARDPLQRYRSCAEFGDDLRAIGDQLEHPYHPDLTVASLPSEVKVSSVSLSTPSSTPAKKLLRTPPPNEDPAEWCFSEVLRLLPDFERKIDVVDVAGARSLLEELEGIQELDGRFNDAIQLCRTRFAEAKARQPAPETPTLPIQNISAPPSNSSRSHKAPPKKCPFCEAENRQAAVHCIECGASLGSSTPSPQLVELPSQPANGGDETKIFRMDDSLTSSIQQTDPAKR
jgi:serine/threonine protein kinase